MLTVVVEFVLRPGVEREFADALGAMQERVQTFEGYLGEEPCRSMADED